MYCDEHVPIISVCLSIRIPLGRISRHFLCMVSLAVACSSSGSIVICYYLWFCGWCRDICGREMGGQCCECRKAQ